MGLLETKDLESWIVKRDDLFGRRILWLARQDWASDSSRSDLVGLDDSRELVLLELKRGTVEIDAVTQALRYLPDYARKKRAELVELFIAATSKGGASALGQEAADAATPAKRFQEFTGSAVEVNEAQAVILVGEDFEAEVLSAVQYLNEASGEDATFSLECWRFQLFVDNDTTFLAFHQLAPPPDLQDEIQLRREERRTGKWSRNPFRKNLVRALFEKIKAGGKLKCYRSQGEVYAFRLQKGDDPIFGFEMRTTLPILRASKNAFAKPGDPWRDVEQDYVADLSKADVSQPTTVDSYVLEIERLASLLQPASAVSAASTPTHAGTAAR